MKRSLHNHRGHHGCLHVLCSKSWLLSNKRREKDRETHAGTSQVYSLGHRSRPVCSFAKPHLSFDCTCRGGSEVPKVSMIQPTIADFRWLVSSPLAISAPFCNYQMWYQMNENSDKIEDLCFYKVIQVIQCHPVQKGLQAMECAWWVFDRIVSCFLHSDQTRLSKKEGIWRMRWVLLFIRIYV